MACEPQELGVIKIARPCPSKWSQMFGDDKVRFCGLCGLNVYNLSRLTSGEARELMRERESGPLCFRFFTRSDGTVMTADCPRRDFQRPWGTPGGIVVVIAALLFWVVSLFADNVRRLNAMTGQVIAHEEKSR